MTQDSGTYANQTTITDVPQANIQAFVVLRTGHPEIYNNRVVDPTTSSTVDLSDLLKSALSDVTEAGEVKGNFLLRVEVKVEVLNHAPLELQTKPTLDLATVPDPVAE